MVNVGKFLAAGLAAFILTAPAAAQTSVSGPARAHALAPLPLSRAPVLTNSQRTAIAREMIAKWQSAADRRDGGGGTRWAGILARAVATVDAANVIDATTARSIDELHGALAGGGVADVQQQPETGKIGNGAVSPQNLGSYTSDLTYTPLPNGRCRIADSRAINSPLVGSRSLFIESVSSYASQGGSGTYSSGASSVNCGITYFAAAYALSITLISPAASGQFKVFRHGSAYQTGNSVSMNAGSPFASADLIVRSCQGCASEIGIQSLSSVHYVIDVIGYYMPPTATALECYDIASAYVSVAANGTGNATAALCRSGYSTMTTMCEAGAWAVYFPVFGQGRCSAYNTTGSATDIRAMRTCCRIGGR